MHWTTALLFAWAYSATICLAIVLLRGTETVRTTELLAALQFASGLDTIDEAARFIDAFLHGNREALDRHYPAWASYRERRVAIAMEKTQ